MSPLAVTGLLRPIRVGYGSLAIGCASVGVNTGGRAIGHAASVRLENEIEIRARLMPGFFVVFCGP
jgi:hypothetical protein